MENYKKFDFSKKAPYLMEFVLFVANNDVETKIVSQNEIISYKSLGSNTLMTEEKEKESNTKISIFQNIF